jgi:para-aminobenzoate synthetase component 1
VNTAKKTLHAFKSADDLIDSLLVLSGRENVCLLDSCGVGNLGSHLLLAGVSPRKTFKLSGENPLDTLRFLDEKLSDDNLFSIFTISYEFGLKLENIRPREKKHRGFAEPDVFLALFDALIIHDYETSETFLAGNENRLNEIEEKLEASRQQTNFSSAKTGETIQVGSNFTKHEYLSNIEKIKEHIRRGDTYQTNLTQRISAELPENITPQLIFRNLRKNHPAPFAAFLQRNDSTVISASPERFFKAEIANAFNLQSTEGKRQTISASPIKGTRPRGNTFKEDQRLQKELQTSDKDLAENVMIVDLLRNDLGKICEFGSVEVEKLCDLETHTTLHHLVSTINGELRENTKFSDIIRAVFPCGSITGAPKISTMRIIDELETAPRGLSMGAIGFSIQNSEFKNQASHNKVSNDEISSIENSKIENFLFSPSAYRYFDLSVAIRTMVVHNQTAVFNVGGGIVIDSDPESEYEETLVKAKALLNSFGGKL